MSVALESTQELSAETLKSCCANLYGSKWVQLLLGDSFHPGGLALTQHIGELVQLSERDRVLDIASGRGSSAIHLARQFGCQVIGLEYSSALVAAAESAAVEAEVNHLVQFRQGDAELLPFDAGSFDVVLCECAFCTFHGKRAAAAEFARVLKAGGRLGLSDLTRNDALPEALGGLMAWVACIAGARPVTEYSAMLVEAGLEPAHTERHDAALLEMIQSVRTKLLGVELMAGLGKLPLTGVDLTGAKNLAREAADAVRTGKLGYVAISGRKPC